ncbi:F0F1 ATP synthase subunit delta [Methylococcus sp. EFPC2]|uniref:F0F1 ATP synthase subunit delta n=1 Tax=Methylococcus sp. EFPC2 TaxID=2812648 RepID=UPI00196780AD|nr:F0F1 ATP synthase subunit delta [Methylococcus sp. EFPC2]QSA96081.1 F0F1 ATP synthase subunit delta [Methylococcus sp. EFPC2]
MSEVATLARPYAVAAYKRARETGTAEQWSTALGLLAQVIAEPRIAAAASNPKAKKEQFVEAVLDLCGGHLDDEARSFVRILVANRRIGLAGAIRDQFEQYKAQDEGYVDVRVATAYPLEEEEHKQLAEVLKKNLGREPRLDVHVDESLIGGVLIKAGDRVIDASVRGQLQRLAKRLYN